MTRSVTAPAEAPAFPDGPNGVELVEKQDEKRPVTLVRECDCSTALARGLAGYIAGLPGIELFGRRQTLARVLSHWSDEQTEAKYPSAVVLPVGKGTYEGPMTPRPIASAADGGDRRVMRYAEFVQSFTVDVWCNTPNARIALAAMLEEAFNPVDWRYGFEVWLPFFHSLRGGFSMLDVEYEDAEDAAKRRWRRLNFTLQGRVAATRILRRPLATPRKDVDVSS